MGASLTNYPLALTGRVIFGLGGESIGVAQSTLLALYFHGKEVALAMGINLSASRLGSVANSNVTPAAYEAWGLALALWLSFVVCCVSLLAVILIALVEVYSGNQIKKSRTRSSSGEQPALNDHNNNSDNKNANESTIKDFTEPEPTSSHVPTQFSDVKNFEISFWLLVVNCIAVYASIFPFYSNASSFLQSPKYHLSIQGSGRIQSLPFIISAFSTPFLGGFVDKFGHRVTMCIASAGFVLLAHLLLGFSQIHPAIPFIIIGVGYSLYASAFWPCIPFVVQQHLLGTAYGVVFSFQNGFLAVIQLIYAAIHTTDAYVWRELFSATLSLFGIITGLVLWFVNKIHHGVLNLPSSEAAHILEQIRHDRVVQEDQQPLISRPDNASTPSPPPQPSHTDDGL